MLRVTAVLRDNVGSPVVDEEFAGLLARGAGFSLLPFLTPLSESLAGHWQMEVPQAMVTEGDFAVPVNFPNTETPVGLVSVYKKTPRLDRLVC